MSVVRRFQLHILELDEIASSLRESAGSLEEAGIAVMQLATQTARTRPNSPELARTRLGQLESFAGNAAKTARRSVNAVREQAAKDQAKVAIAASDGVRIKNSAKKKKS